jgi:hypothetical protein
MTERGDIEMIRQFAQDLHDEIASHTDGDLDCTCTVANFVVSEFFPQAERFQGWYGTEQHEWARVDGVWLDATAPQFGAPVLASEELPESEDAYDEYERTEMEFGYTEIRRAPVDAEEVIGALEERGWERI